MKNHKECSSEQGKPQKYHINPRWGGTRTVFLPIVSHTLWRSGNPIFLWVISCLIEIINNMKFPDAYYNQGR
jgi:hypothetical protein